MFTNFYNLRAEPFLLTPDERFYFESTVHSQAMAHLTYGLTRGEGFIVITGDVGAGKTTLVKRLIATIDANKIIAAHVVTTLLSGHDLLRMVAAAFGLENLPQDKSGLLLRLQNFFNDTHQQGRRALLIVDEAQNLSETALEELRMLSNFQIDNAAPFQSFLVGQPQFRRVIASSSLEQLRQRVIASYHLGPLSSPECGQYLMHRLGQVGWTGDPKFEPNAIGALYRHSGGIPRRINTLGSRLMILGFLDELHTFTAEDVNRVAADLANETSVEALSEAPTPAENDRSLTAATAERLHNLERRISRQELFVRRVGTVVKQFVHLANSTEVLTGRLGIGVHGHLAENDPIAGWRKRPVAGLSNAVNAMTVDVEDYFQVEAFFHHVRRADWDRIECRVEANVERILQLFSDHNVKGTFFTLGWIAKRYPALVRRIVENGHELASHGVAHVRADQQSRAQFASDVRTAKDILEDTGGTAVLGYRATSFSITRRNLWALSALEEAGYGYSSSTHPIKHDLYGIPEQPRFAFYPFSNSNFVEIPVTTMRMFGRNWPASGGGGYFRLLPYPLFRQNLKIVQRQDLKPCTFYFHPWEIDPGQPKIAGTSFKTRFRHYLNLNRTYGRLEKLLRDFRWSSIASVYGIGAAS